MIYCILVVLLIALLMWVWLTSVVVFPVCWLFVNFMCSFVKVINSTCLSLTLDIRTTIRDLCARLVFS